MPAGRRTLSSPKLRCQRTQCPHVLPILTPCPHSKLSSPFNTFYVVAATILRDSLLIDHRLRITNVPLPTMPELKPYKGDYYLWDYVPSLAASVVFTIAFFIATVAVSWRMLRTRTWFCIPFVLGGVGTYRNNIRILDVRLI